jgi:ABC-type antimicrobial peptide transport system permease subunit
MILAETFRTTAIGVGIGVSLGIAATILLRSQFYGIGRVEWSVLLPVSAGMLAVAVLVAYFSASPWLRVDPMEAVKHA